MSDENIKIKKPVSGNKVAEVPVVMQLEALECGAASLAMILAYYDKWVPLEKARVDCGVSRDGSSAKNIYKAANNYGLEVSAYKFELDEIKTEATFPCIIHWNFNHFVVLDGFKGDYAYLNDPARGNVKITMEEFDSSFTGVCLMFEPGENFKPSGEKHTFLKSIQKRIGGLGRMIIFGICLTIFSSIIGVITPAFSEIFFDNILVHPTLDRYHPFLVTFSIVAGIQVILSLLTTLYNLRASGKLDLVGSSTFMWKVLRLPMRFFSQRMAGDIISRKNSNASISQQIVDTISPLFIQAIMMLLYFAIMIQYNWILTLVAVVSSFFSFFFSRIISKKRLNSSRILMRDSAKLSATAVAGIEMIETIKASGAEDGYFGRWAGYQAGSISGSTRYQKISAYYGLLPEIVSTICSSIILCLSLYLTLKGEFTLGMITAFQGYLSSFLSPVNSFISAGQTIQEMQTEIERLEDVMNYPNDTIFDSAEVIPEDGYSKLSGNIEIKNISFGYSILDNPLIKDFSMTIKPGQSVAFVGTSGCGKSTLSKLISGIEKPWEGQILFDGKTIDQIDRSTFTSSVAVVDQDIIIFGDSIKNNIKMYDNSIEDFEMIMAARDAQLHEDIMQRDNGYDHVLCEGGKDFSGGQRQRLEIARVLAQDPTICILDEATSALDAKTEFEVVNAIRKRNITTIVIAHRLSTIRHCDEIIVLDHGNVVERGTHEQLMSAHGYYSKLISAD